MLGGLPAEVLKDPDHWALCFTCGGACNELPESVVLEHFLRNLLAGVLILAHKHAVSSNPAHKMLVKDCSARPEA